MKNSIFFLTAVLSFSVVNKAKAYDFSVDNEGKTIYYNIAVAGTSAEVTFSNRTYSGNIVIPADIVYDGEIYSVTTIGNNAFYSSTNYKY
jgi:hypothetical protein